MKTLISRVLYFFAERRAVRWSSLTALLLLLTLVGPVHAQQVVPTDVVVRAVSQDAKLIQDPVGGARITIRNADTGEVLAEGRQTGDSGSTEAIMQQPHPRGADIYDTPGAAVYRATLDLATPTRIEITAEGPLDYPKAMQRASTTMWITPGDHVRGNGVVLTLHGFIVEVLSPTDASNAASGEEVDVRARVRMMCGCPTEPGGLWDSDRYTIQAQLMQDGAVVAEAPLTFAGTTNIFSGPLPMPDAGADRLRVVVSDAERANFGVADMALDE